MLEYIVVHIEFVSMNISVHLVDGIKLNHQNCE